MRHQNSIDDLSVQAIEAYQQAINDLVEKVKPGTFRVVELKPHTLTVQLDIFLDDLELFKDLQTCSLNWEKRLMSDDENPRIRRGWVFEWVWGTDLLLKLIKYKVQGIVLVEADTVTSIEPVLQFLKNQQLWIGIPMSTFESGLPSKCASWNLLHHDQKWYWVQDADKLINDWLMQPFKSSLFHNPMSTFLPWQKMPQWLEKLGLTDYFRHWLDSQLKVSEVSKTSTYHSGWKVDNWAHPADQWLEFYSQFPQSTAFNSILGDGLSIAMAAASLAIEELKQAAAQHAREESRQGAIPKACSKVEDRSWTKADLQALAQKFGVGFKKSDSKPKLVAALLEGDKAQIIAEDILEIPRD